MIYAHKNVQELATLKIELKTTSNAKWYRRLKVIDLSSQGYNVSELAQIFNLSEGTIRHYIDVFKVAP